MSTFNLRLEEALSKIDPEELKKGIEYHELSGIVTEAVDPKYINISADDFNSMPDGTFYRFWEPYLRMLAKRIYKANYLGGHDKTYDINLIEDLVQLGRIKLFEIRKYKKLVESNNPYAYIRLEVASAMKRGGHMKDGSKVMPHWVVGTSHRNWDKMVRAPELFWDRQIYDLLPSDTPDHDKRDLMIDLVEYSDLTDSERKAVSLVLKERSVAEISQDLGFSVYRVESLLKSAAEKVNSVAVERGYTSASVEYEMPEQTKADALYDVGDLRMTSKDRDVLSLYQQGMSQVDIARHLGVSYQVISFRLGNILNKLQGKEIPKRVRPKKGDDLNAKIQSMLDSGMDEADIGKDLGLSALDIMRRVKAIKRSHKAK